MKRRVIAGLALFLSMTGHAWAHQTETRGIRITPQDAPAPPPPPTPPPPVPPPPPNPICQKGSLAFDVDDPAFDKSLAHLAADRPRLIVIDIADPFPPDQPPPALRRWLFEIQKSGGALRTLTSPCERGWPRAFQMLFDFTHGVAKKIGDAFLYRSAGDYNANLYVNLARDKLVKKVVFIRRDVSEN